MISLLILYAPLYIERNRNHLLLFNLIVAMEFITMVFSYNIYIYIYVLYTYNYILNYMYGFFVNHEYSLYTLNYRFVV